MSAFVETILSGTLISALISILSIRLALRKLRAETEKTEADADRAEAEAESMRIDNADKATRILINNIVEPLKTDLTDTRNVLENTKSEMVLLRKAVTAANSCPHFSACPVIARMRSDQTDGIRPNRAERRRQHRPRDNNNPHADYSASDSDPPCPPQLTFGSPR